MITASVRTGTPAGQVLRSRARSATGDVISGPASDALETYPVHIEGEDVVVEAP